MTTTDLPHTSPSGSDDGTGSDLFSAGDAGLEMTRHFTDAHVHPYDELDWELRDAVTHDYRSNAESFRQEDVEFPSDWSLNATTIVATKYFRGALGTPERERSVKQMIDRVADTITDRGIEHGYFADEAASETFRAELKHLLVNQKAAFNSPVWFNIGVEGRPQQCSACFILSVEDTMGSILNWYVEEGMIFQGGSGAGTNLSRIRGSNEGLSGGGHSSGPISFMRGADASAGTIASGGKTRRAAKMVILDADHPDIEEFIATKAKQEDLALALKAAGYDPSMNGEDAPNVLFQNANNSVGATDEFMQAVVDDADWELRNVTDGEVYKVVRARELMDQIASAAHRCGDPGLFLLSKIQSMHTTPGAGPIRSSNPCSEFVRPDNSSCNLASLNLLKFVDGDGRFEVEDFVAACEVLITAMDILVAFADFPTEKIGEMTRRYRDLGLGFSNLGALLMRSGLGYDSDEGRAYAGAITALMTGAAYRQSSVVAEAVGPFEGYAGDEAPMERVLMTHAAAIDDVASTDRNAHVLDAARRVWADTLRRGAEHGYRNAQVSLLAPTGCLDTGTLVTTSRGLVRIGSLGDAHGEQWQELDVQVSTDEGPREATKFYVNGLADIAELRTVSGSRMRGTPQHRVKIVGDDGAWQWRHLSDVRPGDVVPIQLGGMVGSPNPVRLPDLEDAHWNADHTTIAPREMSADLSELIGLFMGDGSYHAKGLRFSCEATDTDTIERIKQLSKTLFHLEATVAEDSENCVSVQLISTRLVEWWDACGLRKHTPSESHYGKGYVPHVPDVVLHTNDPEIYGAFLRGVFTSDGTVHGGRPAVFTAHQSFLDDLKAMLLVLGLPTRLTINYSQWGGSECHKLTLVNASHNDRFQEVVGFSTDYKSDQVADGNNHQSQRYDLIPLTEEQLNRILAGAGAENRERVAVRANWRRNGGGLNRRRTTELAENAGDAEVLHLVGFYYDTVDSCELTGEQVETVDLSVPDNTTYVAQGLVSHNTISFLMDCDTTGIEPDLGLVKRKKLAGGSSMEIVNESVPAALAELGYEPEVAERIRAHIAETGSVLDCELHEEHVNVFACAMGDVTLSPDGHMKMMAACQPFLSGAISKTVNLPEEATVEQIRDIYVRAWQMGLKCIAVYRDNCKNEQPLSVAGSKADGLAAAADEQAGNVSSSCSCGSDCGCGEGGTCSCDASPKREKLPRQRTSRTTSFRVGESSGYITVGEYEDGHPGEVFLKLGKQGSTLSGLLDGFAISMSLGLQYGVPLEAYVSKFLNMRFEPAGMTDDPDARIAQSLLDYVARRMAFDYLPREQREAIGLLTTAERSAALDEQSGGHEAAEEAPAEEATAEEADLEVAQVTEVHTDAPMCLECGGMMVRAGSCFCCEQCGTTSGCS